MTSEHRAPVRASAPPRLRAVIVDDEPLSRRAMRQLLDGRTDVEVIAELHSVNGLDALMDRADVLFLDIEMPVQSGLELAHRLASSSEAAAARPHIVFVTAHDEYAVPAFDTSAVDYLTKPVAPARLERAMTRLRERIAAERALTDAITSRSAPASLVTRVGARDVLIPVAEIILLEADGVYTVVHRSGRRHLVRRSLDELERMLGPAQFLRVHRSYLVRRSAIVEARPSAAAPLRELVLVGGVVVPVSRRRQAALARALKS